MMHKRFDHWAGIYDQSVMQKSYFVPVHSKMLDLLVQELKDPPRCIIDIGCGTGRLLRKAALHLNRKLIHITSSMLQHFH